MNPRAILLDILDLARWAPSGDNTQPWRFEIIDDQHVAVHGFDTREHCVYDLDGHASQLALGCLLENIAIAASAHGLRGEVTRRQDEPDSAPVFDVRLHSDRALDTDLLVSAIASRTVQRKTMRTAPLTPAQQAQLSAAAHPYEVLWFGSLKQRTQIARLTFDNAKIRLTIPEAFAVHRAVIEWGSRFSADKVPDQAIGASPLSLKLMRWAMQKWERIEFLNTWLGGTLAPRIELDFLPGLCCAAHAVLLAPALPLTLDDHVAAGRTVQRFWLTATHLGLQLQPEMTPLIFARYARYARIFSQKPKACAQARTLAARLDRLLGENRQPRAVFMARLGMGKQAVSARSLRLPLEQLWWAPPPAEK